MTKWKSQRVYKLHLRLDCMTKNKLIWVSSVIYLEAYFIFNTFSVQLLNQYLCSLYYITHVYVYGIYLASNLYLPACVIVLYLVSSFFLFNFFLFIYSLYLIWLYLTLYILCNFLLISIYFLLREIKRIWIFVMGYQQYLCGIKILLGKILLVHALTVPHNISPPCPTVSKSMSPYPTPPNL